MNGIEKFSAKNVCIVGAGPAGLCLAQKFLHHGNQFNVTIFEKSDSLGGQWIYTDDVDFDQYGLPVHSSLYRNLRTNAPLVMMEFDDYPHKSNLTGFVSHQQVLKYIQEFANHFQLDQHIKFHHLVTKITRSGEQWFVEGKNLQTSQTESTSFDIICLCQGRFSKPYIPTDINGLDRFQGEIIHSHKYRKPEPFTGKRVMVLGGIFSGVDISVEVSRKASATYFCHNLEPGHYALVPAVIAHRAFIESIDGKTIRLTNGHSLEDIDVIILATGYAIDLDIIDPSCGIKAVGGHVQGVFLHMINMKYPTMAIFSLLDRVPPFKVFCQQAKFFVRTITGEVKLPSYDEMLQDVEKDLKRRQEKGLKAKYVHRLEGDELWNYDKKLSDLGGFESLSPMMKSMFNLCSKMWGKPDYRDNCFLVHNDGKAFSVVRDADHASRRIDSQV